MKVQFHCFCFQFVSNSILRSEDEEDGYEISDNELNKLLIVTQTSQSSRSLKHDGHDRTGDWTTRTKMSQDLEQAIDFGLHYYEESLQKDGKNLVMLTWKCWNLSPVHSVMKKDTMQICFYWSETVSIEFLNQLAYMLPIPNDMDKCNFTFFSSSFITGDFVI